MTRRRPPRKETRRLAQERIEILWKQAIAYAEESPEVARQRVVLLQRVAQRARMRLPSQIRRRICTACGNVLVPGRNARVRLRNNRSRHVTVTCLDCGAMKRYPIEKS